MKKNHLFTTLFISFSFLFLSFANPKKQLEASVIKADSSVVNSQASTSSLSNSLNSLRLQEKGLSQEALHLALKGYEKLVNQGVVNNSQYLTIVDLSQSSRNKRFYILDMKNDTLAWNTYVAHGKNSGIDEAVNFSNKPNSDESSLGFYLTKNTYQGKHGLSLRISGLEKGFNDNAESRGIVVHGAPYVTEARVNSDYMGRSQGCPALPENEYAQVINIIRDGSVLFVYHPSEDYLQQSELLR